ncbi:MAG TPA: chemotaxis protein CheW [Anaeromyxobacteraceae bacterium]|nr:chemotaxis protein CheW [Anaeromyxobacteraceae bacterium]
MSEALHICTFVLAERTYALPVGEIQEVVRQLDCTPVPLSPGAVRGLANLRGQITMAVDLRRRLMLPPRSPGAGEVNIVVRSEDGPVCLIVDEVGDVLDLPGSALEPPPETLRPALRQTVRGLCKLEDQLVLVLDTARAIDLGSPLEGEPQPHPDEE